MQPDGSNNRVSESLLGVPDSGAGPARRDSPQNNEAEPNMNANNAEAATVPSTANDTTEPVVDSADPNTAIEIIVSDNNNQMAFRIRKNTKMGKMMARYAEHHGRNRSTMRFLFDGDKIVDSDTPASVSKLWFPQEI